MISTFKLLLLYSLANVVFMQCPNNCNCQSKTLLCEICLSLYYQTYDLATQQCNCYKGFQKYYGGGSICCPITCKNCYYRGCASCREHASIVWNNTFKYYDCICRENYYLDGTQCVCMSNRLPNEYYNILSQNTCKVCPKGCNCSKQGCYHCAIQTRRIITQNLKNTSICECIIPFKQVQGQCSCPINCTCSKDKILQCLPSSRLYLYVNVWVCKPPYIQINGYCQCIHPYIQIQIFGSIQCVCKSKLDYSSYYQFQGNCFQCGQSCVCNQKGAYICTNVYMRSQDFSTVCINNSTNTPDGGCACVDPFYEFSVGYCHCLSEIYPEFYTYQDYLCKPCPQYCKCNFSGCFQCLPQSLRKIQSYQKSNELTSTFVAYHCSCDPAISIQLNNKCQCKDSLIYNPETFKCECMNKYYPQLAFIAYSGCYKCPHYCLCDQRGCYYCDSFSNRIVEQYTFLNQENINITTYICFCRYPLMLVNGTNGICGCTDQQQYSQQTGLCHCVQPYFSVGNYVDLELCYCKYWLDAEKYFQDYVTQQCQVCPLGCICNDRGCYQCNSNTLRYTYKAFRTQIINRDYIYYRCPCIQNTFQINKTCYLCPNNSYPQGFSCIQCPTCKTCNFKGCQTCNQNMTLKQMSCICNNANLTNIDGQCICHPGFYFNKYQAKQHNDYQIICLKCPFNCLTCQETNGQINCLSCNIINTFRQDISQNNCPCMKGYVQSLRKKQFCCISFCQDCDELGCLSCPLFSLRTLINRNCLCLFPYTENIQKGRSLNNFKQSIICKCPIDTYYYNQSCLPCPPKCNQCFEVNSIIQCLECRENSNRNTSFNNCSCLEGFQQNNPPKYYCTAIGCLTDILNCSICKPPKQIDSDGRCICLQGYFQDSNNCFQCEIGCLICDEWKNCLKCNMSDNYYLSSNICLNVLKSNYLISQTTNNKFLLQIELNYLIQFDLCTSALYLLEPITNTLINQSKINSESFVLPVIQARIQGNNILLVTMQNPSSSQNNVVISFLFFHESKQSQYDILNIFVRKVFSEQNLSISNVIIYQRFKIISICLVSLALVIQVLGYKHNQSILFMQNMIIVGLFLDSEYYETSQILFSLKFVLFMFDNVFQNSIIPHDYIEYSPGNFKYIVIDSNLFRMTFIQLIFQCSIIIAILIFMFILKTLKKQIKSNIIFSKVKKIIFRILQFLFKTNMNIILIFSFQTFINIESQVYIHQSFKTTSILVSIFCIIIHGVFTIYLCTYANLSKFNKIQLSFSFFFSCLIPIVLIISLKAKHFWVFIIPMILILRDILYYLSCQIVSEDIKKLSQIISSSFLNLQIIGSLFQMIPPILIYYNKPIPSVISIIIIVMIQLVFQCHFIYKYEKTSKYDKMHVFIEQKLQSQKQLDFIVN